MSRPFLPLGIATIITLLLVVGYTFWYRSVLDASAKAADVAGQVELKSGALSETTSARLALAALVEDEAFVEGLLLSDEELVQFLEDLEASGNVYKALVSVVSVSDDAGHVRVAFSIEGTFDAVMRTLGTIEYGPSASAIQSVTLDTPGGGQWSANVIMRAAMGDTN